MLTILKRSLKRYIMGYALLTGFLFVSAGLTHADMELVHVLAILFIPACLWRAVVMDFGDHSDWVNVRTPWRDPAYKEAGINELGSITKYP